MVTFNVKERVTFRDITPLMNEFIRQANLQLADSATLLRMFIMITTDLTAEQIENLTIEELDEVLQKVSEKYTLEKFLRPFAHLQARMQ